MTPAPGMRLARAAMHVHSDWSFDATWPLPRIARVFGAMGCEAVLMSEHDTWFPPDWWDGYVEACAAASTRRCRLIPGMEWSTPGNAIHVPAWGMGPAEKDRSMDAILDHVAEAGGAAVLAHPRRKDLWRDFAPHWADRLAGIEVWNRRADGLAPFDPAWEIAADHGLAPMAAMDFHGAGDLWPAFAIFEIPEGSALTLPAAVAALRAGRVRPAFGRRALVGPDGERSDETRVRMERWEARRRRLGGRAPK